MPPFFKSQIGGWVDPKTSSDTSSLSVGLWPTIISRFSVRSRSQRSMVAADVPACSTFDVSRTARDVQHVGNDLGRRAGPRQRAGDDPVKFHAQRRSPRAIWCIRFSPLEVKGRSSSGIPGVPGSTAIPCRTM